jgi:ankyrin repeat protein
MGRRIVKGERSTVNGLIGGRPGPPLALYFSLFTVYCLLFTAGCGYQSRWAAVDGDTPALVAQLDAGLDVNTPTALLGTRLLILAAAHGHTDTVQTLLERKADVNVADVTGWTPLHAAAYGGKPEIIQLLLDHGATVPPSNWYTPTPLELAEMLGHQDAVDLLKKTSSIKTNR